MATTSTERVRALRARRRAAIEADPDAAGPRDADELLGPAIAETLAALDLGDEHAAAAKIAEHYATVIDRAKDQAWAARWIGPLLLGELGATPAARAKLTKNPNRLGGTGPTRISELRRVHRQQTGRP